MAAAPLNQFALASGVIERLEMQDSSACRLKSLGVFEGQTIEVSRRGNPLIVKAAGSRVAIAADLAEGILVRDTGK